MENSFFIYLLQSTLIFCLIYLTYHVTVKKLTFHGLNRFILIFIPIFSLVLPLVDFSAIISGTDISLLISEFKNQNLKAEALIFTDHYSAESIGLIKERSLDIDYTNILLGIYIGGAILALLRFTLSIINILKIRRNSILIKEDNVKIFVSKSPTPFSFFSWIFLPEDQTENIDPLILKHELEHVKQWHSLDLIFIQLFQCIYWFNPIIKLYRKEIKALHEHQADDKILKSGTKSSDYLSLILKNLYQEKSNYSLSYFNNLIIKKRIEMITKSKSKNIQLFTYSALLIVAISITFGFAVPETIMPSNSDKFQQKEIIINPPSIAPIENFKPEQITSLFNQNIALPKTNKIVEHHGIDIRAFKGTPVLATGEGLILKAEMEGNWGNLIVIQHSEGYQTWYAHLDGFEIKKDQNVKKGDVIGYVGSTGKSSGPHLHYEVRQNDRNLNPLDFITE